MDIIFNPASSGTLQFNATSVSSTKTFTYPYGDTIRVINAGGGLVFAEAGVGNQLATTASIPILESTTAHLARGAANSLAIVTSGPAATVYAVCGWRDR